MEKFSKLTAKAASLPFANIDTDMIIPKQYLKTIKRSGLGQWLFAEMRYDINKKPVQSFILNQKPEAKILLAGENFGCGSSREHAPWALMDFGIRAVIAPSFADIFYNNSYKNGLLLIKLDKALIAELAVQKSEITVDLETQKIIAGSQCYTFQIESNIKESLINGHDAIEGILHYRTEIESFETTHFTRQPWLKGESDA